jgi:hypothetical protein
MTMQIGLPGKLVEMMDELRGGDLVCRPASSGELGVVLGVSNGHVKIYWFNAESGSERRTNSVFRPREHWRLAGGSGEAVGVSDGGAPPLADTEVDGSMPNNLSDGKGPGPAPQAPVEAPGPVEDIPQAPKGFVDPNSQKRWP